MDKIFGGEGDILCICVFIVIDEICFVLGFGQNWLCLMIENWFDWVFFCQCVWGVLIIVFIYKDMVEILKDEIVNQWIFDVFVEEGVDVWFVDGFKEWFFGSDYFVNEWDMVMDIFDVWFDSGLIYVFCLEKCEDLGFKCKIDGGMDYVFYLEGFDQYCGWFYFLFLESCGICGYVFYDVVLIYGFIMVEDGCKMFKFLGNQVFLQDIIKQYGVDILCLWVVFCDYVED